MAANIVLVLVTSYIPGKCCSWYNTCLRHTHFSQRFKIIYPLGCEGRCISAIYTPIAFAARFSGGRESIDCVLH